MKKILLLTALWALTGALALADDMTAMLITLKTNETLCFVTDESPRVTFENGGLTVAFRGGTFRKPVGDVRKWTFEKVARNSTFEMSEHQPLSRIVMGEYQSARLGRTLRKDAWNTFCVPFSMTREQVESTFGEGTVVRRYAGCDAEGKVLRFDEATGIEAGVAYLVRPTHDVANPTINGICVSEAQPLDGTDASGYGLRGVYAPAAMKSDGTQLFVTKDGKLSIPDAEANVIPGIRAFIVVPADVRANLFSLGLGGGLPTGVDGVARVEGGKRIFNLRGEFVGTSPDSLPKGVYIVEGRKLLVR